MKLPVKFVVVEGKERLKKEKAFTIKKPGLTEPGFDILILFSAKWRQVFRHIDNVIFTVDISHPLCWINFDMLDV